MRAEVKVSMVNVFQSAYWLGRSCAGSGTGLPVAGSFGGSEIFPFILMGLS